MRIGIHVRGFDGGKGVCVQNAVERGAETLQIFASSPRQWRLPAVDPAVDAEIRHEMKAADLEPMFIHASYLVNLSSPTSATRSLARSNLEWTFERAGSLGARGVVVHAGSCVGGSRTRAIKWQAASVLSLLGSSAEGPRYLIELTAGGAGAVASKFEQAAELIDACGGHPRIGICLDTCHLHAAGYDIRSRGALEGTLDEFDSHVGFERLDLIHANDSRDPHDSRRDRHWHLGEGYIGASGFRALASSPRLAEVPFICETPGKVADDRENVAKLKRFRPRHQSKARGPQGASKPAPADPRSGTRARTRKRS